MILFCTNITDLVLSWSNTITMLPLHTNTSSLVLSWSNTIIMSPLRTGTTGFVLFWSNTITMLPLHTNTSSLVLSWSNTITMPPACTQLLVHPPHRKRHLLMMRIRKNHRTATDRSKPEHSVKERQHNILQKHFNILFYSEHRLLLSRWQTATLSISLQRQRVLTNFPAHLPTMPEYPL